MVRVAFIFFCFLFAKNAIAAPTDKIPVGKTYIGQIIPNPLGPPHVMKALVYSTDSLPIADSLYQILPQGIKFNAVIIGGYIEYYYYPNWFSQPYSLFKDSSHSSGNISFQPIQKKEFEKSYTDIPDGIRTRGSIARGIGLGNTQGLVVNSNLNLQVSGRLQKDIQVLAVVSDDNNPIQPEGNTQQIQDFDKVYISMESRGNRVTVGDYEMKKPEGYFMSINKRSRGVSLHRQSNNEKWYGEAAVSRGRFVRQVIQGMEGIQGPYRLQGKNNELQIIIIAGTEAIYIDGERLKRGDNNDYVIDYNLGEITFTPRRRIQRFSRIIAEFQYADRNFGRSVYRGGYEKRKGKNIYYAHLFSEQDLKNQSFQQSLSDNDKRMLRDAGDLQTFIQIPSAEVSNVFDPSRILYIKRDTLIGIQQFTFYQHAPVKGNDSLFYVLSFSRLGHGKGHYRIAVSGANGRVFQWVAPVNGQPAGEYEPVRTLIAPNRQQLLTGGWILQDSNSRFQIEGALSGNDKNVYTSFSPENDGGVGIFASGYQKFNFNRKSKWTLSGQAERVSRNFKFIERYRDVEFSRQWSKQLSNEQDFTDTAASEWLLQAKAACQVNAYLDFSAQGGFYHRENAREGWRQEMKGKYHRKNNELDATADWLQSILYKSTRQLFDGYTFSWNRTSKRMAFKTQYQQQMLRQFVKPDSLFTGSYHFQQFQGMIEGGDSVRIPASIQFLYRIDQMADTGRWGQDQHSFQTGFHWQQMSKKGNRILMDINYREVRLGRDSLPGKFWLGRTEADGKWLKDAVIFNGYIQMGSGQELQRQYSYLEVAPGNGQYQWNDYNGDGLQQVNEFAPSVFKDQARFIRIFLPSVNYIQVLTQQANAVLHLHPSKVCKRNTFWHRVLKPFNTMSTLRLDEKLLKENGRMGAILLPINNDRLISAQRHYRNTIFLFRNQVKWGGEWTWQKQENKFFLLNGAESRTRNEHLILLRYNPTENLRIQGSWKSILKQNRNVFYLPANYTITQKEYLLTGEAVLGPKWRITPEVSLSNINGEGEEGQNQKSSIEIRYILRENAIIQGKYEQAQVRFTGDPSSPMSFDVFNGYLPGINHSWSMSSAFTANKQTLISLQYDGRKLPGGQTVHIGRVEARYLF